MSSDARGATPVAVREDGREGAPGPSRRVLLGGAGAIAALALIARLTPVLSSGGLHGLGNYDDAVHFAASVALVHGRLPYRDFLFLHPPGILLLLSPAAALGALVGDPDAMALARLGWMALGAVNALLVARLLLPLGAVSALLGGVAHAVFFPAVYSEHTLLLEAPATTCLLLSLVLLRALAPVAPLSRARLVCAGAVLGASVTLKIWGIVPVLVVAAWLLLRHRPRDGLRFLAGAAAAGVVVCLPFFVAAPEAMWRMVVTDQLGRRTLSRSLGLKVSQLSGMSGWRGTGPDWLLPSLAAAVGVVATAWTLLRVRTRLLGVMLVVLGVVLLSTPSWFLHYAGLTAAPAALVLGAAGGALVDHVRRREPVRTDGTRSRVLTGLLLLGTLLYAYPLLHRDLVEPFPGPALARALAGTPGCVATDDPGALVETDLLRRNLARGCPVEIDLGGASYDLEPARSRKVPRADNPDWQRYCLAYYRSSSALIPVRFSAGDGYSRRTAAVVRSWPVAATADGFVVRTPQPGSTSP